MLFLIYLIKSLLMKGFKLNIQVQKLDIIFLTDIHTNHQNLEKLANHIRANSLHFDYCLVGGDIVNCDHKSNSHQ